MIRRTWLAILDHFGGFGLAWAMLMVWFSYEILHNWPLGRSLKCLVLSWLFTYVMVRAERIKDKRKQLAREVMLAIAKRGDLERSEIEALSAGLQ